ncbi:hypothetical protein [Saccharothrix sp. HUAS TT1]|uniref:hypothetical protein n=1 Tax=unclassified Saccharothrix TaxID=2593673 RepID=UPI00345B5733
MGVLVTMWWEADTAATGVRDARFMVVGTLREHRRRGAGRARAAGRRRPGLRPGEPERGRGGPSGASGVFEEAGFTPTMRYVRWALEF